MRKLYLGVFLLLIPLLFLPLQAAHAALIDQINQAFREINGRNPAFNEWEYWASRVRRGDKTSYASLLGAIAYQKAHGTPASVLAASISAVATGPAATGFRTDKKLYPSSLNPNFLPDGTLAKSPSNPNVYYIRNGKKSWVIPSILDRWLGENHFYKHDLIITIPDADLARYPQTSSVNPLYVGKVLKHPNGTQYYIDDKLRKRELSPGVRAALKFPAGNLYGTTSVHLQEFATGPKITRMDIQPGGMAVFDGPFRGGRIWRIEEDAAGKLTKRLFLSDYLYEAYYYPDENQRVAVSATELARYARGPNIEKYPDGWVVGIGTKIYVVQRGALRLVASPQIFSAMGYKQKYVLKAFPEFLVRYPKGNSIAAFRTILDGNTATASVPAPAPNAASNLEKVRPTVRALIADVNNIYLSVFDKDVTPSENKFWVDYLYNGEVNTKKDLLAAMRTARATGRNPAVTSRTAVLSEEKLEQHWFPYLFYFVHQKEPEEADRNYWFSRINDNDRNTIEKLGGTLQWLKDTSGTTRK